MSSVKSVSTTWSDRSVGPLREVRQFGSRFSAVQHDRGTLHRRLTVLLRGAHLTPRKRRWLVLLKQLSIFNGIMKKLQRILSITNLKGDFHRYRRIILKMNKVVLIHKLSKLFNSYRIWDIGMFLQGFLWNHVDMGRSKSSTFGFLIFLQVLPFVWIFCTRSFT